jgi:acyl dehydratase
MEQSLNGTGKQQNAASLNQHISQVSVENVQFSHPIFVGDVLSLKAKVIYADPKKGLAYV